MIAQELITRSFYLAGIYSFNQSIPGGELNNALESLNSMLDSWKADNLFNFSTDLIEGNLATGQVSYSIGVSGDFVAQRPTAIDGAYVRQNGVDYPLEQIDQRLYDTISIKNLQTSFPNYFYYNPTYPNGTIYIYPVPSNPLPIFIRCSKYISHFDELETEVNFPPGYNQAVYYSLASELAILYGNPREDLEQKSIDYVTNLKRNNLNVLELGFDTRMPGFNDGRNRYNIFTGQ